jgi:PAS domain S-box-containing protein
MTRWSGARVGLLLLGLTIQCASSAGLKHVLILFPYGHDATPFSVVAGSFCTTLEQQMGHPVDFYEFPLDLARYDDPEMEALLADFLEARVKKRPVDLVVVIGGASVQFAARYRERIFPEIPVIVVGADPRFIPPNFLRTNATYVTCGINPAAIVEGMMRLQPQTTNIVMVFGASALESYWVNDCRRQFQSFTNRVGFTWLNGLPLAQLLKRCAALPPRSSIMLGLFVVDGDGVLCENNDALRRLHQAANAPVFGIFASDFGLGTVGGRLYQDADVGAQGARTAIRILRGERPENIPPQILEGTAPEYDWRELKRWAISEGGLPAGSIIQFRKPGFWELYRWRVCGTIAFCLFQTALIVALLVNLTRRRQGEAVATLIAGISSKFVNLPAGEVDREIVDAQRRIFESLDLDISALWQSSAETPGSFRITHFFRAWEGPQPAGQMNSEEHFPWIQQQTLAGRTTAVCSMTELPEEAARDRETFRQFGIMSNLTIPLSVGGGPPIGALGFNTTRAERQWPDALVKRLQLVAQIFANALARERAERVLRESEERTTLATDAANLGTWGWDIDRDNIWGSKRWRHLFGFASGDIISYERIIQRIHPEDRNVVEQKVRLCLVYGSDYRGEFRTILPDGTQRWILSHGRVYPDKSGKPARMLGTSIDITGRKQAEAEVRDLSGRLIRAHEEERARLARELHDDVTQRLARLAIDAGRAEGGANGISPAETMRSIRDGLVRLSEDVHILAYRLHPAVLEDLGLAEALKAECERFSRREAVPAHVTLRELPPDVPKEMALCLFRVTQEALRNAALHARARTVKVSLRTLEGGLELAVRDDGAGFVPALQRERPSLGLASMRERVRLLEGELDIESAPGHGTTILVWVPLKRGQS